ncbi:MobA/MobL family protein [Caproiciproducens sp.]
MALRPLEQDGTWGAKCRKEYELDEHGQRIRLPSGKYKSRRVNTTDWNDKRKAEQWRSAWADLCNRALEQKGLLERIDHRSYKRQSVEQIPTVHMGVAATQMERRGIPTEKGGVNREIAAQNKLLKEIKVQITRLYNWSKEQAAKPEERRSIWEQLQQAKASMPQPESRYGKVKALKESTALFNFLQSNGITSMRELYDKISAMNGDYYALRGEIVSAERQLAALNERLSLWKQYSENKAVHKRLSGIKPGMRDTFTEKHRAELILFDAAAKYFDELKASGEAIDPKKWRAEVERLTTHKDEQYQHMKAMREDIRAVEKIRKTADQLAKAETHRNQEHDR